MACQDVPSLLVYISKLMILQLCQQQWSCPAELGNNGVANNNGGNWQDGCPN
jgi:hypothetical protein